MRSSVFWLGAFSVLVGAFLYYPFFFPDDPRSVAAHGEQFFFRVNDGAGAPVLILSLWLFYRRSHLRDVLLARGAPKLAALVLASAAALFGWGAYTTAADLQLASVIGLLAGTALLFGGAPAIRAFWLPILFLGFALPISPVLLATVLYPAQLVTAELTGLILNGLGFDSVVWGDQILRSPNTFVVIETCSGIRTIVTLSMLTVLLVDLFERRGWHAALLMGLAPVIAFATNALRVVTLVLNPHSDIHSVHNLQGLVMLLFGLTLIYLIDGLIERRLGVRDSEVGDDDYGSKLINLASRRNRALAIGAVVLVLFGMLALDRSLPRFQPDQQLEEKPSELLARVLGEDPATPYAIDYNFMGSVQYLAQAKHRVAVSGAPVEIHLGVADERLRQHSILTKRLAWPGTGFAPIDEQSADLGSGHLRARRMLFRRGSVTVLSYSMILRRESFAVEWFRKAAALDRSPMSRDGHLVAVRLSTPLGSGDSAEMEAEDRLRLVWRSLETELVDYALIGRVAAEPSSILRE